MFNIAIGADSADLQRTARSALLQMLNTIVKRVTQAAVVGPLRTWQAWINLGLIIVPVTELSNSTYCDQPEVLFSCPVPNFLVLLCLFQIYISLGYAKHVGHHRDSGHGALC